MSSSASPSSSESESDVAGTTRFLNRAVEGNRQLAPPGKGPGLCQPRNFGILAAGLLVIYVVYRVIFDAPTGAVPTSNGPMSHHKLTSGNRPAFISRPETMGLSSGPGKKFIKGLPEIPARIHRVYFGPLPDFAPQMMKTWEDLNPGYEIILYDKAKMREFIQLHHPRFLEALPILSDVQLSDMMRYTLLYTFGGIYVDVDTELRLPLDDWAEHFGINPAATALIGKSWQEHHYYQWFMCLAPGHPIAKRTVDQVFQNALHWDASVSKSPSWWARRDKWAAETLARTGPNVWSRSVEWFLNEVPKEKQLPVAFLPHNSMTSDTSLFDKPTTLIFHAAKGVWRFNYEDPYGANNLGLGKRPSDDVWASLTEKEKRQWEEDYAKRVKAAAQNKARRRLRLTRHLPV